MTHGDKAKAKTGKSSQASGNEKSSQAVGKNAQSGEGSGQGGRQSGRQADRQSGRVDKIAVKKQNGGEKGGLPAPAAKKGGTASASAKEAGSGDKSKGRSAAEDAVAFSSPAIAAAFQRAVQKYPNAFRKLTD